MSSQELQNIIRAEAQMQAAAADLQHVAVRMTEVLCSPTMSYEGKRAQLEFWIERKKALASFLANAIYATCAL